METHTCSIFVHVMSVEQRVYRVFPAVTVYKSCSNDVKGSEGAFKRHNMALVNIANHYISENGDEVNFTVAVVSKNCYKVCLLTVLV